MRGVLVPAWSVPAVVEIPGGEKLRALQEIVGGWIEAVVLGDLWGWGPAAGIVNEEGLLLGLPLNPGASLLAGQRIVGPMVVVGVDVPEFVDCGDQWCAWVTDLLAAAE